MQVVELIKASKATLDIAMYSLNNPKILASLNDAKSRGVKIRLLLDRVQASGNHFVTLGLKQAHFNVRIHSKNRIQHNKFVIADGNRVETGSFNWTAPAEEVNEENCVFMDDPKVVEAYAERFNTHLWIVNSIEKSDLAFKKLESKYGNESRTPAKE